MKSVLFVAAEAVPFAKTGGMGDVVGSLPKELKKLGVDVRIILPKYDDIPIHLQEKMICRKNVTVPVGWRRQYGGLLEAEHDGLTYYFVDNEYYFKRRGLYGFVDDAERFAFFCRASAGAVAFPRFQAGDHPLSRLARGDPAGVAEGPLPG